MISATSFPCLCVYLSCSFPLVPCQIKALLVNDPQNEELLKIEKDLEDCITLTADVIFETKKALGQIEADDPEAGDPEAEGADADEVVHLKIAVTIVRTRMIS